MCGCERHHRPDAECTCLCPEHKPTQTEKPAPTPEQNIGEVARGLQRIHDDMVARIGDVYVNISATWQGPDGKLTTFSYGTGTVDPDDEDDDA